MNQSEYQNLVKEIHRLAMKALPRRATVLVASKGDDNLLKLAGRTGWHFPRNENGVYAGHYPADSNQAIQWLEQWRAKGAGYFLLPSAAFWWLEHYREFRRHLEENCRQLVRKEGVCAIYQLARKPNAPPVAEVQVTKEAAFERDEPIPEGVTPEVKLIAFYQPQFHPIPENDAWRGEGFTDWTNVGKTKPLFPGHHQPHLPADLGFYDLRLADTRAAQAELARAHGIHGFCYHHYWFGGKRLLERPFNEVLASGQPDFPFCLCWANEPWSRRGDGGKKDILQPQVYSATDDVNHIRALIPALKDSRAIRIEGKPVFIVHQGRDLPDAARTIQTWRAEAAAAGLPGIYLMAVETGRDAGWNPTTVGFDATVLFAPQSVTPASAGEQIPVPGKDKLRVFDYQKVWPALANPDPAKHPRYETVCPAWDNSARRGDEAVVWHNSTPAAYEQWLRRAVANAKSRPTDQRVVFVNAWNDWGAGCHLEPDLKNGRAYLQATRRVVLENSSAPRAEAATEKSPQAPAAGQTIHEDAYLSMLATARGRQEGDFVPLAETSFAATDTTLKLLAFYLPQFHPIPENDEWWGKGFTEWTNASKAVPQFVGHYQPHWPGELGFYDLRVPEVQRRQVELAKRYGLSGFCFYHYWFAGKRLLERPLDQFVSDPEIDFPFCICWANENWSRRWDGREDSILIKQDHSEESDFAFIRDVEPLFRHKNYIRINDRPLLIIYRPHLLPHPAATARRWREYCRKQGLGDPFLVAAEVFTNIDPRPIGFDAVVEFPPNTPGIRENIAPKLTLLNPAYTGAVYRYSDMARWTLDRPQLPYPLFRTVCPAWDNEPRRPGAGSTFAFSSPAAYQRWLETACRLALATRDPEKRIVFVNAWNEWGEGAHLEPDRRYGYAYLQATANAIRSATKEAANPARPDWTILFISHDAHRGGAQLVLLNLLECIKRHTSIRCKVLCLKGGEWLPRFQALADTITLPELQAQAAATFEPDMQNPLLDFCGGKPGLIYGNSVASGQIYPALRKLGAPIVTHFHELETSIRRYAGGWIGDIVKNSAHHIACSDAVRDCLIKNERIPAKKISTVFASIQPDKNIRPLSSVQQASLRKSLGLPAHKQLVFGCGLGMPFRKGADLFIEVARQLRRLKGKDFHFYWIGKFYENESDPKYGSWAGHLAALEKSGSDLVTFLGPKDNPKQYLQTADIFLLPSREDPFPLVALEAAECGVPTVCFAKAGGMPGFVGDDAGAVVPYGNVKAMARRVKALLEDKARLRKLGLAAREKLLSRFTVGFTAPQIVSVCRTVARKKPAVSIIVPNFNHARYLPERLESIFNQSFKDFEVILLDDASTDGSMEVLERYRDHAGVRIVRNERNSGSTFKQWLKGMELAQADIVWFAESDDRCEPDFIASLLPAFQNPRVKLAYANSHVIDENGAVVGEYTSSDYLRSLSPTKWTNDYTASAGQEINDGLGVKNTILSASAVMFRKFTPPPDVRETLEGMRIAGDWYFIIHAIAGGDVQYVSRKLNHHRRHSESVVGKLLKQNRVTDFFREFYTVQSAIFDRYQLLNGFPGKWEKYLKDQWAAFFPGRPFNELSEYYPVDRARQQIAASCAPSGADSLEQKK